MPGAICGVKLENATLWLCLRLWGEALGLWLSVWLWL